MITIQDLKALWGPEQTFCADTAPAHAGLAEVHESIEGELANAIYDTIVKERYKTVLEIGTHYGCATAWMLLAVAETQGALTTVDVQNWDRDLIAELGMDATSLVRRVWPNVQDGDVLRHWQDEPAFVSQLPKKIDMAVVDAMHAVDETEAFVRLLAPRVRSGGQLCFHDSFAYRQAVGVPLRRFFDLPENFERWSTIDVPIGCGMFVARKIKT